MALKYLPFTILCYEKFSITTLSQSLGFPSGSVVKKKKERKKRKKNPLANAGDTGLIPGSGRQPGKSQGQRSLVDYSPWGGKASNVTALLSTHALYTIIKSVGS